MNRLDNASKGRTTSPDCGPPEVPRNNPSVATQLRKAASFLFSFGLAKGVAFVAALLLPRLLDTPAYAFVELALTVGLLAVTVLGFGCPEVATRMHLVEKRQHAGRLLLGYCLWLCACALLSSACLALLGHGIEAICCAAMIGLNSLQFAAATYSRIKGRIHLSGWFDNIPILLVSLIVAVAFLVGANPLPFLGGSLLGIAVGIIILTLILLPRTDPLENLPLLPIMLTVGVPMMLYGVVNSAIFATPRLAIAKVLTSSDVASFSLCARIALILVFVNQVISTGLFRQLYELEKARVGQLLMLWIVFLSVFSAALTVAALYLSDWMVLGTDIPSSLVASLFPAVTVQAVLWILNSNLQNFVNRELASRLATLALLLAAFGGLAVGAVAWELKILRLHTLISIYSGVMVVTLLAQMRILSRAGIPFGRAYAALPLIGVPLLSYL